MIWLLLYLIILHNLSWAKSYLMDIFSLRSERSNKPKLGTEAGADRDGSGRLHGPGLVWGIFWRRKVPTAQVQSPHVCPALACISPVSSLSVWPRSQPVSCLLPAGQWSCHLAIVWVMGMLLSLEWPQRSCQPSPFLFALPNSPWMCQEGACLAPLVLEWAFLWSKSKTPGTEASGWVVMPWGS